MITQDRKEHQICSGNTLAKITGLEICGELSFTNASLVENAPYFPITGPMNAGITLYKRDVSMTGYKFEARSTHVSNQQNLVCSLNRKRRLTESLLSCTYHFYCNIHSRHTTNSYLIFYTYLNMTYFLYC